MNCQHVLLALMLVFNQDIVSSHILTTTRELPLPTCMRLLAFAVNELCVMYGESSEERYDLPIEHSRELETKINDFRVHTLKRCCIKPCALPELMSIC